MCLIRKAFAFVLSALTLPLALGQAHRCHLKDVTIEEMKIINLSCDRAQMLDRLNTAEILKCYVVYEEIKWHAFDGDFEKLLIWPRSQPADRSTGK